MFEFTVEKEGATFRDCGKLERRRHGSSWRINRVHDTKYAAQSALCMNISNSDGERERERERESIFPFFLLSFLRSAKIFGQTFTRTTAAAAERCIVPASFA